MASGVEKLVKPVYPDHPLDSFANVRKTETYDPAPASGPSNGDGGERGRCRCSRGCTCSRTATSTTTPPARRSTRSASPTTRRSGTSRLPTTRTTGRWKDLGDPGRGRRAALGDLLDLDFGQPVSDLAKLGIPGGGKSVTRARVPRLHLLGDAAAPARRARALHEGVVPHRRRRGQPGRAEPGQLLLHERRPHHHRRHRSRRTRISTKPTGDMHRPRWYTSGVLLPTGEAIAFSGRRPRRGGLRRGSSSRSSRPSSGIRRPATGRPSPRRTGRGPTTTPPCSCPTGAC